MTLPRGPVFLLEIGTEEIPDRMLSRGQLPAERVRGQSLPGHLKGDGAYVLAQRPDYIILGPAHGVSAAQPWFLSDHEIAGTPSFHRDYRVRQDRLDVKHYPGWRHYSATRAGELRFTYYERRQRRP